MHVCQLRRRHLCLALGLLLFLPVVCPESDGKTVHLDPHAKPLPEALHFVPTTAAPVVPVTPRTWNIDEPHPDDTSFCSRVDPTEFGSCLKCTFPRNCSYGDLVTVNCSPLHFLSNEPQSVQREAICQYCYQTDPEEHECEEVRNCSSSSLVLYPTTCRVAQHVVCLGRRTFLKNVRCQWTNGYSWSRTMLLSVTLGGFGVDRFYLGLWKSAIGKLFSFGGLGVWTLIDIVLIGIGYIQPADGSMYI
uniref:TM2 domain-containing protein n=1 Tax=Panagrellus redivivus TaxID=6233 RepID=A0A7E4VWE4_PANRE